VCPLCGAPIAVDAIRCGECGLHLAGVAGRPGPFSRRDLWWSAVALLVIYLLALLIVALAR
jgi:predicted amidophosphoribosyltransferase